MQYSRGSSMSDQTTAKDRLKEWLPAVASVATMLGVAGAAFSWIVGAMLSPIEGKLETLEGKFETLSDLPDRVSKIEGTLHGFTTQLATVNDRLLAIENRLVSHTHPIPFENNLGDLLPSGTSLEAWLKTLPQESQEHILQWAASIKTETG